VPSASSKKIQRMLKEQRRKLASPELIETAKKVATDLRGRFAADDEKTRQAMLAALIAEHSTNAEGLAVIQRIAKAEIETLAAGWHFESERAVRDQLGTWRHLLSRRAKPSFDNPISNLFHAIAEAQSRDARTWFVSISDGEDNLTFGSDNWIILKAYALVHGDSPSAKGITIRRRELNPAQQPPWRATMSGVFAMGQNVRLLPAEEIILSHSIDAATGEPIEPDPNCAYVGTAELLPSFAFKIDPDHFSGPSARH